MHLVRTIFVILLLTSVGCTMPYQSKKEPPPEYVQLPTEKIAEMNEEEYLMRKAIIGSRSERMEALKVISKSKNPKFLKFLLKRLKKEDDRFLKIQIMDTLGEIGDVRAVGPLRKIARWNNTRVGIEAVAALYKLGDDSMIPKLIFLLRKKEEMPEAYMISYQALKRLIGENLPPKHQIWTTWYHSHRLSPQGDRKWYWPFAAPIPPTQPGTTITAVRPDPEKRLPKTNMRFRRAAVSFTEFWKPEE